MENKLRSLLIVLWGMLLFSACDKAGNKQIVSSEASLTIRFNSVSRDIATRGIEDLDDDGTVSEQEEVLDGRRMYRLAVFVVYNNIVEAYTVLEEDDLRFSAANTAATISFDNLDYGKAYQLYAVANYGDYGTALNGHLADVDDTDIINGTNVSTTADNLCNKNTPYPLSLKKEILLQPGANNVTGELIRTYARIRINVRNQSNKELKVTNLQFADNFSQSSADLFVSGGSANVTPDVTSDDAIAPFTPNLTIAPMDGTTNVSESTIFDGYLLESNGGDYDYTLGLELEGATTTEYIVGSTAITNPSSIESGAMYLIYNANARRYLYANGTSTVAASSNYYDSDGELNQSFVWRFTKVGSSGNNYKIESMGSTGYYINSDGVVNNSVPLTVNSSDDNYFTASSNSGYIRFRTASQRYYLGVNQNNVYGTNSSNRRNFALYKVTTEQNTSNISHQETIEIKTVDDVTGEVHPIQEIRRNDFINILVNVSYNEKSGEVVFEVSDWNKVEGEVTFD